MLPTVTPRAPKHHIRAQPHAHAIDATVAALAETQHGVVAREQLAALGVGRGAIERWLGRGRLHRLHRGVYAVGHRAVSREGRWLGAVLASGLGARLGRRSAGALWEVRDSSRTRVEVIVPVARRPRPGIELFRSPLRPDEVTVHRGIPVTTPARTLLDLAAILSPGALERAVARAEMLRLADATSLEALVARYPRRPGTPALRRLLGGVGPPAFTRSELEARFLAFLDAHGLPRPRTNAWLTIGGRAIEVDCLWAPQGLVAELDGYASHGTRTAFESDRARDRALQAAGLRVLRITWRQLEDDPGRLAADLERLLRTPHGYPGPRA